VTASGANLDDIDEPRDENGIGRQRALAALSAAELSVEIVSPTPDARVASDRAAVRFTRCDLRRVVDASDQRRNERGLETRRGAVSDLAETTRAPAPDVPVARTRAAVRAARSDLLDVIETYHSNRSRAREALAVTELPFDAFSPTRDRPALVTRARVRAACRDAVDTRGSE
jgi:hypothetical protein